MQGDISGIVPEVIAEILNKANLDGKAVNYPPKRTNQYLLNGKLDFDLVNPDWIADEDLKSQFVFSNPVLQIDEYFVKLQNTNTDRFWSAYLAHNKPRVGTVRGYFYHDSEEIRRVDFASEQELVAALTKGRIDVAIIGDLPAAYWANRMKASLDFFKPHSSGFLRIRMRKELAHLLPQINSVITEMHESGQFELFVNKYVSSLPLAIVKGQ